MPKVLFDYIRTARQMQISLLPRDAKLSRRYIVPIKTALLELARRHRRKADDFFRSRITELPGHGQDSPDMFGASTLLSAGGPRAYPVGCCLQIRDWVWERLSAEPLVRSLRQKGLTWKKVYFIQDGIEFQNAIQCGDWLLDVARDTVDPTREPIVFAPLDTQAWENLNSLRRFAEVASVYYRLSVYPNRYFPLLFPMIPFLAVRESGRLELLYCQQMLFFLDLGDNWRRVRAVLEDRNLMARTLPPEIEQRLLGLVGADDATFSVELRKCSAKELAETLREWEQILSISDAQASATLRNYEKLAAHTARKLRQMRQIDIRLKIN